MSYNKMMHAYKKSDQDAIVESDDPHAMVFLMFEELLRAMNKFVVNVEDSKGSPEERSKSLSRALSIIYGLQTSLNFEDGGEIAENLFRLYEYARIQLITDSGNNEIAGTKVAISALDEICDAWGMIGKAVT
ncbi:flagellar export chaperone FliS [Candidatus Puniceispirillum marinum]|jgi:flagellar protein FliS|uniref:Flagellar secretion chaperone FliS n=1 Tax=Puniceispirillum marinum (strain IMCC1322) TaxID=488538 RepID=D5BS33_PUNMI|nr:flagellar protein FliS [Candidatus Puniceispirillum marinum]ADE39080.1 Flagellin-specific chaperone FliS-like protein [Candidatus Puniceispirillum marinum IMCC1322]